ncbi:hypothetical protein ACC859_15980 [Rhizobium ruizarguesonis]
MVAVLVNRISGVTERIRNLREIHESDVARAPLKKGIGELRRRERLFEQCIAPGCPVRDRRDAPTPIRLRRSLFGIPSRTRRRRTICCGTLLPGGGRSSDSCRTSGCRKVSTTTVSCADRRIAQGPLAFTNLN